MSEGAGREPDEDPPSLDDPIESASLPDSIPCPFCTSTDTSQFSAFGGQASTSQYYCNACRTVFEAMRWR